MSPVLRVEGLTVSFCRHRAKTPVEVVSDLDLEVKAGETVALVGESGAGKSTVARAIAGLVRSDRGRILLDGVDVLRASPNESRRLRRGTHLVFQDPYASLPPTLRTGDIVAEPLVIHHRHADRGQRRDRVREALAAVGLEPVDRYLSRYPHELSGGERQRVAFARALVTGPRLILADEPTQMLDASRRIELVDLISELSAQHSLAVLHITHDLALAQRSSARLVVMHAGRVVEQGPTAEMLSAPVHDYTVALLAAALRTC